MNVNDLQLFVDAARLGSFAAVARAHTIDPSSVSRTISSLEADLGSRLFNRSTRTLSLTEAGERYLRQMGPILEEIAHANAAVANATQSVGGVVRLTASVAFGQQLLAPLIPALRELYPALAVELLLTDDNLDLIENRVDLAIRLGPEISGDLICAKLCDTRYRVVASSDWTKANDALSAPSALSDVDCLLFTLPQFRNRWLFKKDGMVEEVSVRGQITVSNARALFDLMLAGNGPCLLSDWLIREALASGDCIDLFPDHEVTATTFQTAAWLVYPSRSFLPAKTRAVIEFVRQNLA